MNNNLHKEIVFNAIFKLLKHNFNIDDLKKLKTKKGNTQNSERSYIKIIKTILNDMGLTFKEAGTQQSKDFRIRIKNNLILHMECKKTDKFKIYFNDTCPTKDIYYIIIFTGKEYKRKSSIKPQIIRVNGDVFFKKSPWVEDYKKDIEYLKDKWGRGENAKKLCGPMSVYPRPTYKTDIRFLLK